MNLNGSAEQEQVNLHSCKYVRQCEEFQFNNKSLKTYIDNVIFKDQLYLKDNLKSKYAKMFRLKETESMFFKDAYEYADVVFSQIFQGNK